MVFRTAFTAKDLLPVAIALLPKFYNSKMLAMRAFYAVIGFYSRHMTEIIHLRLNGIRSEVRKDLAFFQWQFFKQCLHLAVDFT